MAKTKQKLSKINGKNLIVLALAIVVLSGALYYGYVKTIKRYNEAADYTYASSTRELIFKAIDNLEVDAPIQATTGDVYFPPAKLYLPYADSFQKLAYMYNANDKGDHFLSITDYKVIGRVEAQMSNAMKIDEIFDKVPKLQACSRGVTVSFKPLTKNDIDADLRKTVHINNGKTLYLYLEKACPELEETLQNLTKLRAY